MDFRKLYTESRLLIIALTCHSRVSGCFPGDCEAFGPGEKAESHPNVESLRVD